MGNSPRRRFIARNLHPVHRPPNDGNATAVAAVRPSARLPAAGEKVQRMRRHWSRSEGRAINDRSARFTPAPNARTNARRSGDFRQASCRNVHYSCIYVCMYVCINGECYL